MYIAACYKSVRNMNSFQFCRICAFCLFGLLQHSDRKPFELCWHARILGFGGCKKSQHAWLGGWSWSDTYQKDQRPQLLIFYIIYSTVDVYWICHTSKPWFVEIPWSYGSSMVSEIQRLKCLNSKLLRNPRLALKRVFLGTQWGSWDHEHWMHIKKGIDFQFLLVSHILW